VSLWTIAWHYLWDRKLTTCLTILSVAISVGLISSILTVLGETRSRFEEEQSAYDIVVGQGSKLQLVLNAVYFLDRPTANIPYDTYLKLKEHEDVTHAFPIQLGDSYNGFRIVGTVREIFDFPWVHSASGQSRYPYQIESGEFFDAPMEAVLGFQVAQKSGLTVGDQFAGNHGTKDWGALAAVDHSEDFFTVVGIMKPSGTSNDRAIFVNLQSVWDMHDDHDDEADGEADGEHEDEEELEVSAVLIDLYSEAQRFTFIEYVNKEIKLTPAVPVFQILNLYNQILAPAVIVLLAIGYVIVLISALSIMIGLYLAIIQRKRDLAIMRALGATAPEIFGSVLIEAFLVTILGIGSGWVLGKALALAIGQFMGRTYGLNVGGVSTSTQEIGFFAIVSIIGLIAGVVPAWQAYQTDVAKDLQAN
jgi:putative ABC transport system permease protein